MNIKSLKKITFISIFIISSSCAEESPQLDAYLYRVFDNYPCCKVKDNCQKLYYNRYIQLQYVLKNEISDTLFLPINIVNGYNSYNSSVKIRKGSHIYNIILDQTLSRRKNDSKLAKGKLTTITITLFQDALDSIGIKTHNSPMEIADKINFIFCYNRKDYSHLKVPHILFHNKNNQDWIDLSRIRKEFEPNWTIYYDGINRVFYCFLKPGTKIHPIKIDNSYTYE